MSYIRQEELLGVIMIEVRRYGADTYMPQIKAHRLVGDREVVAEIQRRGLELGIGGNDTMELLLAIGSAEEFFDIANQIERGEVSLENIMDDLQE
jgi:hypothetical protein